MRDFVYLQLVFCATACTICVDTAVYRNLASHLTLGECRELVASLYYTSYELPTFEMKDSLAISFKNVSYNKSNVKDNLCVQLLTEWDKKEGENSTHIVIERRLRQMSKIKLADWLGKTVFHQLASDINDTLLQNPFADSNEELALNVKLLEDKALLQVNDKLTRFDSVLRLVVIILFVILMFVCFRIIHLSYVKTSFKDNKVGEEMKNLLYDEDESEN